MPGDSITPPDGSPQQHHNRGSSDLWDYRFSQLESSTRRIESKVDGLVQKEGEGRGRHDLLEQRVEGLEKKETDRTTDARQMSLGLKVAVAAAIVSPLISIALVAFKHTP